MFLQRQNFKNLWDMKEWKTLSEGRLIARKKESYHKIYV